MKLSVILTNLGACSDRYMTVGYADPFSLPQLFARLGQMRDIQGVELIGGSTLTRENAAEVKRHLTEAGLVPVAIIPDHFGKRLWGKGAFTHPEEQVRKAAIAETMDMVEAARVIGCDTISLWNGQDGFDYPLQADYAKAWDCLVQGIAACAKAAPDIRFAIEYKPKEPRTHSFVSSIHSTLLLCEEIGLPNVGVTIDTGHATEGYENLAQSAVMAMRRGKLFHLHMNDNYGYWDDDMITGSVHTVEYIELFWWLNQMKYDGFISIDQYPYREDGLLAAQESIDWMHQFDRLSLRLDAQEVQKVLAANDAVASTRMMRKLMFPAG